MPTELTGHCTLNHEHGCELSLLTMGSLVVIKEEKKQRDAEYGNIEKVGGGCVQKEKNEARIRP